MATADRFNLAEYFVDRHVAEGRGAKIALVTEAGALTYAEVLALVNQAGNALRGLGVGRGDRVLLLLPDGPDFVAAYFGAARIGAVAAPTSTALRAADYAYFLKESEARAVVVHQSLREQVAAAPNVVVAPGWLDGQPAEMDPATTRGDDPAFWLWTSGSTGAPKAAVHRHGDWLPCCEGYARGVLGIGPHDATFSSSKLFHAYGLGNSLLFPFYTGASSVLYAGRPQPRAILEMAEKRRPTLFFSVPTLYAAMLTETDAGNPYKLDGVRLGVSAAEPLPAEIGRRWKQRFGFELLDGVGSTEALHIYLSSGRPVPGYHLRLTEDGDLWVRGASVTPGYWNRPELSAARLQDGWFWTGDKFTMDLEGRYIYAGRSDDMFRVSGQWVSPAEVEAVLVEHPAVLESAVAPFEDENSLLKPKAYVVLKPGAAPDEALARELREFVKSRIAPHKYPRRIDFLEELPKTATGKIQRFKLREGRASS